MQWTVPRELLWTIIGALIIVVIALWPSHYPYSQTPKVPSQQETSKGVGGGDEAQHGPASHENPPGNENKEDGGKHAQDAEIWGVKRGEWLLFLATMGLWYATWRLVRGADETAKRQLRPYFAISASKLQNFHPGHKVQFEFSQTNTGNTPAYGVIQNGAILILDYPLPENFPFPKLPKRDSFGKTIFTPRLPLFGKIPAVDLFTAAELIEALKSPAKGKRLYIFGQIDYEDAFKDRHWHRFCFTLANLQEWVPLAEAGNWDAINMMLQNPNVSIGFEAASQHNETDEG